MSLSFISLKILPVYVFPYISSFLASTAIIPCPPAGIISSLSKYLYAKSFSLSSPSLFKPAAASIIPSYSPFRSLFILVSTLPRIPLNSALLQSLRNWAWRRLLPVPVITLVLFFKSSNRLPALVTSTSLASSLGNTQGIQSPSFNSPGKSLALCTAISIMPLESASSISVIKTPLSPKLETGLSVSLSPFVLIITFSITAPGYFVLIAETTSSVCASASALPLVPILVNPCSIILYPIPLLIN